MGRCCVVQRRQFRLTPKDRPADVADQDRAIIAQRIAAMGIEAGRLCHARREERESTRHEQRMSAMRLHRGGQRTRAGIQRDPFAIGRLKRRQSQPLEHGHPRRQRTFEIKLAAHRPFGDRRDLGLEPGKIRQLVEAFLTDDGWRQAEPQHPLPAP